MIGRGIKVWRQQAWSANQLLETAELGAIYSRDKADLLFRGL
jgi:hypothetical protein